MWSIFEAKCVKVVSFFIIHDFASTDVDALIHLTYEALQLIYGYLTIT